VVENNNPENVSQVQGRMSSNNNSERKSLKPLPNHRMNSKIHLSKGIAEVSTISNIERRCQ
jgi:hypothetical protein